MCDLLLNREEKLRREKGSIIIIWKRTGGEKASSGRSQRSSVITVNVSFPGQYAVCHFAVILILHTKLQKTECPPSYRANISLQIAVSPPKNVWDNSLVVIFGQTSAQPISVNLPSESLWPLSPPDVLSFPSDMKSFQHYAECAA